MMTDKLRDIERDAFDAQRQGDYAKAIELWSRLLERQGNWEHGYARYNLAGCYERLGRFDEAEQQYVEAVRIEPNDKLFSQALAGLREARKSGLISERSPDCATRHPGLPARPAPDFVSLNSGYACCF
jgi:tetratricopeptide (TPR) repeat protein